MEPFKEQQRAVWGAGDFNRLSDLISSVGVLVVTRSEMGNTMDVLDVACGTGNIALPAARTGARVTGLDLVPKLLEAGRAKAEAASLDITWVEGDAEDLPFPAQSFDRVCSTFGHMFAPRHEQAAAEMMRVCRPGGRILTCTWTPEGTVGDLFRAQAPFMPPPPDFAQSPILWGSEEHVLEMFGVDASQVEFERDDVLIEWESVESFVDYFAEYFPPMAAARHILADRFGELKVKIAEVFAAHNEAANGGMRVRQEYLLSVVQR